jgi:hypothetical protein
MSFAKSLWVHSPYNSKWNATAHPVFVDDFLWYALAFLRVGDWTGDTTWRQRAADLYEWGWTYGWDHRRASTATARSTAEKESKEKGTQRATDDECGGVWWKTDADKHFKDSITIVELLHVGARLGNASAERVWDWLFSFDDGNGLIAPNGILSTGAQPEWCCSPSSAAQGASPYTGQLGARCTNSNVPGMSYGHGLLLSSAALLHNSTGDPKYLHAAARLLEAALANLTDAGGSGAVSDVQRGSRSAATACNGYGDDPGSDFFSFKGIFVTHVAYTARYLHSSGNLPPESRAKIEKMLNVSGASVWTNARFSPPWSDLCSAPQGADAARAGPFEEAFGPLAIDPPKFAWWWSSATGPLETPPDPRVWYRRGGLNCTYSSVVWSGRLADEEQCMGRCAAEGACAKYTFAPEKPPSGQSSRPNADWGRCLLFPQPVGEARTSEEGCTRITGTSQILFGAKRPPPPTDTSTGVATCAAAGRCSDSDPAALESGELGREAASACMCDDVCARHLDCCLDYVTACIAPAQQTPTCDGRCTRTEDTTAAAAVPLPGGGYCFCDPGCHNEFTDNNSYGSCCADRAWKCAGGEQDVPCLDARSHTQAISLFVAEHVVGGLNLK